MYGWGWKMWKRVAAGIGVLGYVFVVMVARSNIESASSVPSTDYDQAKRILRNTGRVHHKSPLGVGSPGSEKGDNHRIMDVLDNITNDLVKDVLQKDADESLIEPQGFTVKNNSLQPLYVKKQSRLEIQRGIYEGVIIVKRRYLSQNTANDPIKDYDFRLNTSLKFKPFPNAPSSSPSQRTDSAEGSELLSDTSNEEQSTSECDLNNNLRRNTKMCRANSWVPECQARLLVCQPQLCHLDDGLGGVPFLLVVIHSHPSHRYRRDAIRDTWGAIVKDYSLKRRVVFLFLLGLSTSTEEQRVVSRELALYRDVVQYKLDDSYHNLTVKSVLALDWIQTFCTNVSYVLKTDDDAFMNISNIVNYLVDRPKHGYLIGSMHAKSEVQRTGQWRVEKEIYPDLTYPPYCSGTAYVMSPDIVQSLHRSHFDTVHRDNVLVPMEDVYITGILAKRNKITCNNSKPFPNWTTGPSPRSVERFLKGEVFGIHGLSHSGMYGLNKLLKQCIYCISNSAILRKWFSLLTGAT